jgi:Tol biopolymer transport system component
VKQRHLQLAHPALLGLASVLAMAAFTACGGGGDGGAPPPAPPPPPPPAQGCSNGKRLEPDATFPLTTGRVAYHSYRNYGDGTGRLFVYDLATRQNSRVDQAAWGIADPINPHFAPNGQSIAFMGRAGDNWDVFVWRVGAGAPTNLTRALGGRNEDPKFSADGRLLVIKHEGDLMIGTLAADGNGDLSVSSWRRLTNDGFAVEEGIPFFSADGRYVIYTQGAELTMRIWRVDVATGAKEQMATPPAGARDYYAAVLDAATYFFTRTRAITGLDQLMQAAPATPNAVPVELVLNDCSSNNSDAAVVNTTYLVFSSTGYSFNNRYGLVVGHLGDGRVWRFDPATVNLDLTTNKLGASYTPN